MMRYRNGLFVFFSFLALFFFGSCEDEAMPHSKEARRVMSVFIAKVQKKHGLFLTSSGGALMEDVKAVFLSFGLEKRVSVEEARELYVKIAQELLAEINTDEGIRPYLRKYPFDMNDIKLGLSFYDGYLKEPPENYVVYVFNNKNKINYSKQEPKKLGFSRITSEVFSEAVRKVEASRKGR
jgi:hypothetical protein